MNDAVGYVNCTLHLVQWTKRSIGWRKYAGNRTDSRNEKFTINNAAKTIKTRKPYPTKRGQLSESYYAIEFDHVSPNLGALKNPHLSLLSPFKSFQIFTTPPNLHLQPLVTSPPNASEGYNMTKLSQSHTYLFTDTYPFHIIPTTVKAIRSFQPGMYSS